MKYYIADTHFGHANVIKFDGRPFKDIEEMDRVLIENWNSVITPSDDVYVIGDFVCCNKKPVSWYADRLKGKKHLVIGNHDRKDEESLRCFRSVDKMKHVTDRYNGEKVEICLCHYPVIEYNGYFKGHYHIYGHIHNSRNDTYEFMQKHRHNAFNAGCMLHGYRPVTFAELIESR